jgi:lipid II:glycine glycyltransferase (peptidoglycan interpeptide bridge formation enzyme)
MNDKELHDLEEIIKKQKTRIGELEGELSIVKGIGMNSPEMRAAKTRIEELERDREILKQDIDRLSEYNQNLETMMRTKND